jgi:hypothetical protein
MMRASPMIDLSAVLARDQMRPLELQRPDLEPTSADARFPPSGALTPGSLAVLPAPARSRQLLRRRDVARAGNRSHFPIGS